MNIGPILSIVGWVAVGLLVLYIFYVVSMRAQGNPMRISIAIVLILLVVGLGLNVLAAGLVFVPAQERAVVVSIISGEGLRPEPLTPGLHWILPFAESTVIYSIASQNYTMSIVPQEGAVVGDDAIEARTSDGQQVKIDASVIYRIDPTRVIDVHIRWQERYTNEFIRPSVRGVIRDAVAQFSIEEVYSLRRDELSSIVEDRLREQFLREGLDMQDFILRNIAFTPEYAASIEQKQIAEQNALRAQFLVQQEQQEAERIRTRAQGTRDANITEAEGEARATVLRAEAEAEALRLVSQALQENPDLITFRYVEKIAPTIRTVLLPSNAPFLLDFNSLLQQQEGEPLIVPAPTPEPGSEGSP
jgi:regulator of protease activity HflC (stomatin/prohibitin superfamily)